MAASKQSHATMQLVIELLSIDNVTVRGGVPSSRKNVEPQLKAFRKNRSKPRFKPTA